ncbi:Cytochrome P450 9e2 [Gryllus bimaculatus]|nr:Cytochrome P450 9e2 [Gryllus bimaculatus]
MANDVIATTEFFDSLVHATIKERQQKGIFRPDMLQLLMQAREGQLKAEKEDASEAEESLPPAGAWKLVGENPASHRLAPDFASQREKITALCRS